MPTELEIRCVADVRATLGESPVWVEREQALYWVDIKGRKIFRLDEEDDCSSWDTPWRVGSIAPRSSGGFIAGTEQGLAAIDLERSHFNLLCNPEEERPSNRFNDGKVGRDGRFWAGTMDDDEKQASGALYRFEPDLSWKRIDDGYKVTNGPAFSPDGRILYHNDSARQITYAFDLAKDGAASGRRIFAQFGDEDGYPDGMTVDANGHLWICFWDGWCVRRFSPDGHCAEEIRLPVQRPTSCAFGGLDFDRLYISSARVGLDDEALTGQPCAGGLILVNPGAVGLAEREFAG